MVAIFTAAIMFFILCELSHICHELKRIADHMTKESEAGDE